MITFERYGLAGRVLTWPKDIFGDSDAVGQDCWCQHESFGLARQSAPAELEARKRELALEIALEIYSNFGWSEPPRDLLSEAQLKRFCAV